MNTTPSWSDENGAFIPCSARLTLKPGIYEPCCPNCTVGLEPIELVTDDIIVPPDSLHTEILSRIRKFFGAASKYASLGFLHKTSLLLMGQPGCGKTTVIEMVANDFVEHGGVCIYTASSRYVKGSLVSLRMVEPDRNVLVIIEDIESCNEQQMLSLLDGEDSVNHICYLFTTNHEGEISARLGRPGRIDERIEMQPPSPIFREYYITQKLPLAEPTHVSDIVSRTDGFTLADLRLLLVLTEIQGIELELAVAKFGK